MNPQPVPVARGSKHGATGGSPTRPAGRSGPTASRPSARPADTVSDASGHDGAVLGGTLRVGHRNGKE